MRRLILGTAGHIDHGKTALVRSLTGVDTDRLAEEKARGITIDLGFAELEVGGLHFGVVDVPGHEGFIRNMLAGATGIDLVLLTIAADEGIMPQTREHVDIVRMLGVQRMVVALTKYDLVEEEWLELVSDEVTEFLSDTPYAESPVVATSAQTGHGLDDLLQVLAKEGEGVGPRREEDLCRLPIDRVFTIRGAGTVVTGTLWSGQLSEGANVTIFPGGKKGRVRGIQVHSQEQEHAHAGERTALSVVGVERDQIHRGSTLVADPGWQTTMMLTGWVTVLAKPAWSLERGQRVRIHLGTAEVMARAIPLESEVLSPGEEGWVQMRLEGPILARAGDRFVVRSYSPVTTMGGGEVVEPLPPKRRTVTDADTTAMRTILGRGSPEDVLSAVLSLRGEEGADAREIPILSGLTPTVSGDAAHALRAIPRPGGRAYHPEVIAAAHEHALRAVQRFHSEYPLEEGAPLEVVRRHIAPKESADLVEGVLAHLVADGTILIDGVVVALPEFEPTLTAKQEGLRTELIKTLEAGGLAPPPVGEISPASRRDEVWAVLKWLVREGVATALDDDYFILTKVIDDASQRVLEALGGKDNLGPTDFREVLSVSRKHLLPILLYMDRTGITIRRQGGREVRALSS